MQNISNVLHIVRNVTGSQFSAALNFLYYTEFDLYLSSQNSVSPFHKINKRKQINNNNNNKSIFHLLFTARHKNTPLLFGTSWCLEGVKDMLWGGLREEAEPGRGCVIIFRREMVQPVQFTTSLRGWYQHILKLWKSKMNNIYIHIHFFIQGS